MSQSSDILSRVLRIVFRNVPKRMKQKLAFLTAGSFVGVCLETASAGLLAYFASAATNPEKAFVNFAPYKPVFWPDALFPGSVQTFLLVLSLVTILISLFKTAFQSLMNYLQARLFSSISGLFGEKYLRGLVDMPYAWHLRQNSSELVTIYYWRDQIGNDLLRTLAGLCTDILLVFALSMTLIYANPLNFVLVIALCGGIFYVTNKTLRPLVEKISRRQTQLSLLINKHATEMIHGIKDIKLLGKISIMKDVINHLDQFSLSQAKLFTIQGFVSPLFEMIGILLLASIVTVMYNVSDSSSFRVSGTVTLFAVVAWRVLPSVSRITINFTTIRNSLPSILKFTGFLELFEAEAAKTEAASANGDGPLRLTRSLRAEGVSYRYAEATGQALDGVGFTLDKGQSLGVIGSSGAGKSTLIDILIGLLPPDAGTVRIDDVPLAAGNAASWMRRIGYVPQSPYLSDDTLLANIAFGSHPSEIDHDWARVCCAMANIDEFLDALPDGLATSIGERGACLSGGQRQRVAIARALYKRPEIIILDEATSALDARSERNIQSTILSLHGKATMIIIAHRLSTVEHCDRVLWLERGKVRMFGPADAVLAAYRQTH